MRSGPSKFWPVVELPATIDVVTSQTAMAMVIVLATALRRWVTTPNGESGVFPAVGPDEEKSGMDGANPNPIRNGWMELG
jgi:hypothetical protein